MPLTPEIERYDWVKVISKGPVLFSGQVGIVVLLGLHDEIVVYFPKINGLSEVLDKCEDCGKYYRVNINACRWFDSTKVQKFT